MATNKFRLATGFCLLFALFSCQVPSANASSRGRSESFRHHEGGFYRPDFRHYRGHGFYEDRSNFFGLFAAVLTIGTIVALLPDGHETIVVGDVPYYYHDNVYYRACPSGYVIVPAPAPGVNPNVNSKSGAKIGAIIGGLSGAAINSKNPWRGGVIGAVAGTLLGSVIGNIADKTAEESARKNAAVQYGRTAEEDGKESEEINKVPIAGAQPQTSPTETVTINVPDSDGNYTPVTLTKHNNGYIGPQGEYYSGHPTVEQLKVLYGK